MHMEIHHEIQDISWEETAEYEISYYLAYEVVYFV